MSEKFSRLAARTHTDIAKGRLFKAISWLDNEASNHPMITNELDNIRLTYQPMVKFFKKGVSDPAIETNYALLQERLHVLVDLIAAEEARAKLVSAPHPDRFESFYEEYREELSIFNDREKIEKFVAVSAKMESDMRYMFDIIASMPADEERLSLFGKLVGTPNAFRPQDRATLVAAMALALSNQFNNTYFFALLDLLNDDNAMVKARAAVGIMIACINFPDRIHGNSPAACRLKITLDDPKIKKHFAKIFSYFLLTKITLKVSQEIKSGIADHIVEFNEQAGKEASDWTELMSEHPEIEKSVDKLAAWQEQGADIFYSTMYQLKSDPFYNSTINWFVPFDKSNRAFTPSDDSSLSILNTLGNMLEQAPSICESDKNSIMLSIGGIAKIMRERLQDTFSSEIEAANSIIDHSDTVNNAARGFVFDLFRFFTIYKDRDQFSSPFFVYHNIISTPIFDIIFEPHDQVSIADFFVQNDTPQLALAIYNSLLKLDPNNIELLKKKAFSHIKLRYFTRAINTLKRVELLGDNKLWTKRRLVDCFLDSERYEEALEPLRFIVDNAKDNIEYLQKTADALDKLERYDEAIKYLFEIAYKQPSDNVYYRIAHYRFFYGSIEDADKYILKVEKPDKEANILAAHIFLGVGKLEDAINSFREVGSYDYTEMNIFNKRLIELGIPQTTISLAIDASDLRV